MAPGANLVLCHPRSQPLFGGQQLQKALVDVAGHATTHHLALSFAKCKHGTNALQHDASGQYEQYPTELSSEHLSIVTAVVRVRTGVISR